MFTGVTGLKKVCPNCGCQLPEEALFCLNCFHSLALTENSKNEEKKRFVPLLKLKQNKKRLLGYSSALLAFLLIMGICIIAMKTANNAGIILEVDTQTTIIKGTETVAVTDNSGEAVTDKSGEQVFDVIEVTKVETIPVTTTEKQGFFDKIFNTSTQKNHENKKESDTSVKTTAAAQTTEKPGIFDQIIDSVFGDDNENPSTVPTTEQYGTTENSSSTPDNVTTPSTTTKPTQATTVTTRPTTTAPSATEAVVTTPVSDFEYTLSDKYATIKKYTGSASNVLIPAVIEGKAVTRISGNAFQNNNAVQTVTFVTDSIQPYLWVEPQTFNGCSDLRTITFSDTDLGIMNNFAWNCPSIENLHINSAQYKCIDGSLYYNSGSTWKLRWHCPANSAATITLPSYCTGVESASNLKEAVNVKTINIHSNVITLPHPSILPPNCENVFVDDGNTNAFDINGIAFYKEGGMWATLYPSKNRTKSLTLPENTCFYGQYISNSYLETIYIPKTTKIHSIDKLIEGRMFTSLKNVYIQEGHEKEDYILKNSTIPKTATY